MRFVTIILAISIFVLTEKNNVVVAIIFPIDSSIYDYIIVGAGAGGSVLAKKFSANPDHSVLVLDAGDYCGSACDTLEAITDNVWSSNISTLFPIPQSWAFDRSPLEQTFLGPGGSTNIYGADYNRASLFLLNQYPTGYQYNDLLPYYIENEDHYCKYFPSINPPGFHYPNISSADCEMYHGIGGPMQISPQQYQYISPQVHTIMSLGLSGNTQLPPFTPDQNGNPNKRYGFYFEQNFRNRANPYDIGSKRTKVNVFDSFLPKSYLETRPKLIIQTKSKVINLVYSGTRVIGVKYIFGGVKIVAYATNQVFLSAGVMRTPQILQLSGIGPSSLLQKLSIPVVANNPGVGANLGSHQAFSLGYQTTTPVSHNYNITSVSVAGGTLYSSPAVFESGSSPDIQLEILEGEYPEYFDNSVTGYPKALTATTQQTPPFPFIGFVVTSIQPSTRGSVNIQSTDPNASPLVDYGWNSTIDSSGDSGKLIAALEQVRQIITSLPIISREVWPGTTYTSLNEILFPNWNLLSSQQQAETSDDYHIKYNIHPVYHLTGSCGMGVLTSSCTDTSGRVRGVTGLSVCDNSILPIPPDANPTATLLAVCAKVADWHLANVLPFHGPWPAADAKK